MNILTDYITGNFMTLMLLAGLTVILIASRKTKIEGTQFVWAIMGIVLTLTLLEALEDWCDAYNKSIRILYVKTMLVYWLYPMTALLEFYLIIPVKRKLLVAVPQIVNMVITFIDLFDVGLTFHFGANHQYGGGIIWPLPHLVLGFYVVLLTVYSIRFISQGSKSKGFIVIFITVSTLITIIGQHRPGIARGYAEAVAAMDIMVYYFYLAAIQYSEVQAQLHRREIELEKSRLELEHAKNETLMAQIQPHFINNSLMALRSRCFDYPEIYNSITNFSRYLRSNFEALGDIKLLTFEQEMKNIEAYLALEQDNFGERLQVEYNIECDDFYIPALSVQPLVENAVRHGVGTFGEGGTVQINARRDSGKIIIEVIDSGSGKSSITEQQKSRRGIGIDNVRRRLRSMSKGELEIITGEHGTAARITIAENGKGGTDDNTVG